MMSDEELFALADADRLLAMIQPLPDETQKSLAYVVGTGLGRAYALGRQHAFSEMGSPGLSDGGAA